MWDKIEALELQLTNIIGAIVVLLLGLIIGLIVKKLMRRILHEIELDKQVKRIGGDYGLEKRISNLAAYIVYFFALLWSLNQLGITPIVLYIIGGAILLLLLATFVVGIKDFVPNLIAGITINRRSLWETGKKIKVNGVEGIIKKVGWLEMEIETKKGDTIYMPNSLLIKSKVLAKKS